MTIKDKFKGSRVYIGALGRVIEVKIENATLLLQNGIDYVFNFDEPKKTKVKDVTTTKSKRKPTNGNTKREAKPN